MGTAAYHSVPGGTDLAWTHPDPLPEARRLAGLIAFFDERVGRRARWPTL